MEISFGQNNWMRRWVWPVIVCQLIIFRMYILKVTSWVYAVLIPVQQRITLYLLAAVTSLLPGWIQQVISNGSKLLVERMMNLERLPLQITMEALSLPVSLPLLVILIREPVCVTLSRKVVSCIIHFSVGWTARVTSPGQSHTMLCLAKL